MDVVVVGDPGQLPPITAGDPLRALTRSSCIPRSTLTIIRRQSSDSAIPLVAGEIRQGRMPVLPDYDMDNAGVPGVSLLRCDRAEIPGRILEVFESFVGPPATGPDRDALRRLHAARVQILGATRNGQFGVRELAASVERHWLAAHTRVHDWGLSHGSKVLWTRNSYDHPTGDVDGDGRPVTADIMNGSLGIVQRATKNGAIVLFDDADATKVEILRRDLERIERGWAITVHKAQGSAFERVIVPVTPGRLMDRLLVYTAVTRARVGVVLVGSERELAEAVAAEPRSLSRLQRLNFDTPPPR
jgi:exodeoxyribonuclease V alpha subunit